MAPLVPRAQSGKTSELADGEGDGELEAEADSLDFALDEALGLGLGVSETTAPAPVLALAIIKGSSFTILLNSKLACSYTGITRPLYGAGKPPRLGTCKNVILLRSTFFSALAMPTITPTSLRL